ncbi:MAG: C40 family peptidase [Proteobacteria bacterium]|nr:C40 family peptidase [Pseudomonadota bacterium]MBU1742650.1 C40 family peptidase [Pseudomonadota bacterium]
MYRLPRLLVIALTFVTLLAGSGCLTTTPAPTASIMGRYPWATSPVLDRVPPVSQYQPLTVREKVVALARSKLGVRYRYGASGPDRFDCSGFVRYVFSQVGLELPRRSREQFELGVSIKAGDLRPGDLVAFKIRSRWRVTHVGIYLGEGRFIHANRRGGSVRVADLGKRYYQRRLAGYARILPDKVDLIEARNWENPPWAPNPFRPR